MAQKHLVTIVSIPKQNPGVKMVSVGSIVKLVKEPTNTHDSDAIHVLTEDGVNSVGYLANNPLTVATGTKSATEVQSRFEDQVFGKIVDVTEVRFTNGRKSDAFIVELLKEEKKQEEIKMAQVLKFKLVGSKTIYPNKFKLADELRNGKSAWVKLMMKDDKIVAEFENGLCGYIDNKKVEGLSLYDDIAVAIGEGRNAKITDMVSANFIGEFSVDPAEIEKEKTVQTLQGVLQRIMDEDIATQAEIDERMEYLNKGKATNKQILSLFSTYKKYDEETAKRIVRNPEVLYQDEEGIVSESIAYINIGSNLLFEGDRGTGKNVLTETLSWLYMRPLYEFSMNSQHDNSAYLGGKTIETNEKGEMQMSFDPEVIIEAGEKGGLLVLDEFNTGIGNVNSLLNSLLDDRGRITVPGYKTVTADKNFFAIATQNRDYQSTFENNEATIDRFVPIIFPQLKSISNVLLAKVPNLHYDVLKKCDMLYKGIKKCVEDGEISEKSITIRGFITASKANMNQDIPLKRALITNVANRAVDLEDRKAIQNMIEDIVG